MRKTNFEVVPLSTVVPLLAEERKIVPMRALQSRKILSVTFDINLARTREMLFAAAGYTVSTALASADAVRLCESESFDLIVIGHSILLNDRKRLLRELRRRCSAPILGLYRLGEPRLENADYLFDAAESPALLLETIHNILKHPAPGTKKTEPYSHNS